MRIHKILTLLPLAVALGFLALGLPDLLVGSFLVGTLLWTLWPWLDDKGHTVKIATGERGRVRWFAYVDGLHVASSRIAGYNNHEEAVKGARLVLGDGWEVEK